jgi:hypothetical protein
MTVADAITVIVAVLALLLSLYNTYAQRRDRKPRVEMVTSWNFPRDAPMAWRGTAEPGQATYRCEITNVGITGVKIKDVTIYRLTTPGKPLPMYLPTGEQTKKLDNGDSQTWMYYFGSKLVEDRISSLNKPVKVIAMDTVGNTYQAKNPDALP